MSEFDLTRHSPGQSEQRNVPATLAQEEHNLICHV